MTGEHLRSWSCPYKHETVNRTLAQLVSVIAEEMQVDIINAGSTTFKRRDLARGFEPDSCFYIQNEGRISGRAEIDLDTDPPPDLIIEIDITSPSLNTFPVYAHLGVPEVWRYDGTRVTFFILEPFHAILSHGRLGAVIRGCFGRATWERGRPARLFRRIGIP